MKGKNVSMVLAAFVCLVGCIEEETTEEWGGHGVSDGHFDHPYGVAVSPLGYVYVADTYNHRVQKFTLDGKYLDKWGEYGISDGQFYDPIGLAIDRQGNVYVTDVDNHRIQKFTSNGVHLATWGKEGSGLKEFKRPLAVAVDSAGYVYVADTLNNRVQKFDSFGNFIPTKWDEPANQLDRPCGIAVSRLGEVYVSDTYRHRIKKFTRDGKLLGEPWGEFGTGLGEFYYPDGLEVDPWGDLYVVDGYNHRLQKFTPEGKFITAYGEYGSEKGYFNYPYDVAIDKDGNIYVADTGNDRLQKFWFGQFYEITPAINYLPQNQSLQVWAKVYDLGSGAWITQGNGDYLITKDGRKVKEGELFYDEVSNSWRAEPFWFLEKGEFLLTVVVNAQSAEMNFTALPEITTVRGNVKDEGGETVVGLILELYRFPELVSDFLNPPPPLKITTSRSDGFVFNNVSPDRYIIVTEGPNGTAYSPAFWVFGQGEEVTTNLILSPSRASLLEGLTRVNEAVQKDLRLQTGWMSEVVWSADKDLAPEAKSQDEYTVAKMVLNMLLGKLDEELGKDLSLRVNLERLANFIVKPVVVKNLKNELWYFLADPSILEEENNLAKMDLQSALPKVILADVYLWYADRNERFGGQTIFANLEQDIKWLLGEGVFGQGQYAQAPSEYFARPTYQQVKNMLAKGLTASQLEFPKPKSSFSFVRADAVCRQTLANLEELEAGTARIFVLPDPTNPRRAISLNLQDYYSQYQRLKKRFWEAKEKKWLAFWISKGSTLVSVSGVGALVETFVPGLLQAVALGGWLTEIGKGYVEEGAGQAMLSAFRQMVSKYYSNLALSPFVYLGVDRFLNREALSPYYLSQERKFEARIEDIQLMGTGGPGPDTLVAFPQKGLTMAPDILVTDEIPAKVKVLVGQGYSPAEIAVESKVESSLGVYNHQVSQSVWLQPGQSHVFEVPFRGYLPPNQLLDRSKMEFRLWLGPFQVFTATGSFSITSGSGEKSLVSSENEKKIASLSDSPGIAWASTSGGLLSQKELDEYRERLREKRTLELNLGQNIVSQSYQMADDVFSCQIRAYRPLGVGVRLQVADGQDFVGYDPSLGVARFGFPAEYSGLGSNPEVITVFQAAGKNFKVTLELEDIIEEPARIILEVWETPFRPALMTVLPDSVELNISYPKTAQFQVSIGESSHQQALSGLKVELSSLKNTQGQELNWSVSLPVLLSRGIVLAGGVQSFEVSLDVRGASEDAYTGKITVSSTNAGQLIVPVMVKIENFVPKVKAIYQRQENLILSWDGEAQAVYQIQASENMRDWTSIGQISPSNDGPQLWTIQPWPETKSCFYRLKIL